MRVRLFTLVVGALLGSLAIPASGTTTAFAQASDGAVTVTTGQSPVGTVLFTSGGAAVYMLSYDTVGTATSAAKSSCTGRCPGAWPPLLAPGPDGPFQALGGVQQAWLGTIARADAQGNTVYQVTYYGHPLYNFVNDKAPGQTTGENVAAFNGVWNLVTVAGQPNAGVATVSLESSPQGQVLSTPTAFSSFRSLYMLTADPPNATVCLGSCAQFWPPLLTTGKPTAGPGVDPNGLGTLQLPDGTSQVTYFGVPLYHFAFDLGPGAKSGLTNGEDSVDPFQQGVWYLTSPAGAASPAPATVTSTSSALGTTLGFSMPGDTSGASFTLYAFSSDSATASACTGLCARIWNPVLTSTAAQAMAGSAVSQASLGTIQRADGTTQVTYNGHPLYLFSMDYSGTGGQNVAAFGGTFQVMQASGAPSSASPSTRPLVAIPQLTRSGSGVSASFVVSYASATPGQAMILFGPGPGCSGLVEVGTQDAGAGTTSHVVLVSGNDMPGTVGDNGIQPGVTYSFEVVTASSSGNQTDDNSGSCYTVSIPGS